VDRTRIVRRTLDLELKGKITTGKQEQDGSARY
jgi:hypothetical protein